FVTINFDFLIVLPEKGGEEIRELGALVPKFVHSLIHASREFVGRIIPVQPWDKVITLLWILCVGRVSPLIDFRRTAQERSVKDRLCSMPDHDVIGEFVLLGLLV